jgi:hypothetical protein
MQRLQTCKWDKVNVAERSALCNFVLVDGSRRRKVEVAVFESISHLFENGRYNNFCKEWTFVYG